MGLAVGRQKAIVRANAWSKVARTDGNREFCSVQQPQYRNTEIQKNTEI